MWNTLKDEFHEQQQQPCYAMEQHGLQTQIKMKNIIYMYSSGFLQKYVLSNIISRENKKCISK